VNSWRRDKKKRTGRCWPPAHRMDSSAAVHQHHDDSLVKGWWGSGSGELCHAPGVLLGLLKEGNGGR
jgi:hypothetical protein